VIVLRRGVSRGNQSQTQREQRIGDGCCPGELLQRPLPLAEIAPPELHIVRAHLGLDFCQALTGGLHRQPHLVPDFSRRLVRVIDDVIEDPLPVVEELVPAFRAGVLGAQAVLEQRVESFGDDIAELLARCALRGGERVVEELR